MPPNAFHRHIRQALADPALQDALDANARRRKEGYRQAFDTLEDPEELRRRAHAVRAETIAHLDAYLDQFISHLTARGTVVHRAQDAAEAVALVLHIAQSRGARLVAKSKTMVSEEVGLNEALEAAGMQVVETDLGEYIVQLRGEHPSHIITPAVHLRRQEVGATFHERLGVPETDDVEALTAIARARLRQVFQTADVGVSGVNFGVAETGTLCLVTNEGNGRMVTTLPPVHVALMGIERLVPGLDDLALILQLLPRAATGQTLTVYTTLINGPRAPDEPDGPDERHVILVDNGRSAVRASPLSESLLCIRCGACLNACPVFQEIGGHAYVSVEGHGSVYPGPIGSIVSPGLFGQEAYGHLAQASTLCGACREACPVDIDLPGLLLRTRAGGTQPARQSRPRGVPATIALGLRIYAWLATHPRLFAAGQRIAGGLARLLFPGREWIPLPAFTGWGAARHLRRPATAPFRDRFTPLPEEDRSPAAPPTPPAETGSDETPAESRAPDGEPRLEAFAGALDALGAGFERCRSEDLGRCVLAFLEARQETEVLAWARDALPAGLFEALSDAGVEWKESGEDGSPQVGLTGARAGVASTGSIVVLPGPGQPLTASLLPEVHLAVLPAREVYDDLPQVLSLREVEAASSAVLISGPSRTADIEMTLTIGVHGPREVHVIVYE